MAISREKKQAAVADISTLLADAKMTVFANYEGLTVADAQALRRTAQENGTAVKVVKNRLFQVAVEQNETLKGIEKDSFSGQLLYAFNPEDEVVPVKTLVEFSKKHPALKVIGAFNASGKLFNEDQVKRLATLPSRDELRGQLVGTINAPVSGFVNVLAGNVRGLVQVLNARAQEMS